MGKPYWLSVLPYTNLLEGNIDVTFELELYFWNPSIKVLSVTNLCNIGYFITGSKVTCGFDYEEL